MPRATPLTLAVGLLLTAALLTIEVWSGSDRDSPWERWSINMRFVHAPRADRAMSRDIVHVDIDDGALKAVGRWPWDRATLADAIDELAEAGAGAIALDLLFSEPQENSDSDQRLSRAIQRVPAVVALHLTESDDRPAPWREPALAGEWKRMMDVLSQDIRQEISFVVEAAAVAPERRHVAAALAMTIKEHAVDHAARNLKQVHDGELTFEVLLDTLAPDRPEHLRSFPERRLIEYRWHQLRAWQAVRPHLRRAEHFGRANDAAPIPDIAGAAAAAGFVNELPDADGRKRSYAPTLPAPGGDALPFGLAAAALYRGIDPGDVVVKEDAIGIGAVTLPLHNGRLWIDWPAPPADAPREYRWLHVTRQDESDRVGTGHLSIAVPVGLAEQRRGHESNVETFLELSWTIAQYAQLPDDELAYVAGRPLDDWSDALEQVRDEVEFTLMDGVDPASIDDEAFRRHVELCRLWEAAETTVRHGEARVAETEAELRELVEGRLVFIGWTATGALADFVLTPLGPSTPGVVVHAATADMALTGAAVRFLPRWSELFILVIVGLLATGIAALLTPVWSVAIFLLVAIGYGGLNIALFAQGDWLVPLAGPLGAVTIIWVASMATEAAIYQRERSRITRQFRARVSAQLVDYLVENPGALSVGGQQREITILFADLAGFTRLTESLGSEATVKALNTALGELTDELIAHDAYVNKFLGDGVMAFWSAFTPDRDQAAKACRAAIGCQRIVHELNGRAEHRNLPKLGVRLGIATGRVIVGDCGAPPALNDYTVIGNAVNLAARLESANKQLATSILIDGRTHELTRQHDDHGGADPLRFCRLGRISVVGQQHAVDVHQLVSSHAGADDLDNDERIHRLHEAVAAFEAGRADECRAQWAAYESRFGAHPLAHFHELMLREQSQSQSQSGPDESAGPGVIRLSEK